MVIVWSFTNAAKIARNHWTKVSIRGGTAIVLNFFQRWLGWLATSFFFFPPRRMLIETSKTIRGLVKNRAKNSGERKRQLIVFQDEATMAACRTFSVKLYRNCEQSETDPRVLQYRRFMKIPWQIVALFRSSKVELVLDVKMWENIENKVNNSTGRNIQSIFSRCNYRATNLFANAYFYRRKNRDVKFS